MGRLSKRRGAISVFLLIIFMVTYVFMGMLVDAGRYRMAQTYMESALDNASSSVLSNYNQLVFDLYGLFSVDMELEEGQTMEDAIYEKYNHYLQETLGIAEVDKSQYRTMLSDLIFGAETATYTTDSLYDFNITKLEAGSTITLADTANVEQQLIEYMKFRAPVELTKEMEGFLGKLKTIVEMKDRVEESLKKEKIKQKYESNKDGKVPLSEQAATLLKDINEFAGDLYNYTLEPHQLLAELEARSIPTSSEIYNHNPYRMMDYVDTFDRALAQAQQEYDNATELENEKYGKNLYEILEKLQSDLKEREKNEDEVTFEVKLSENYTVEDNITKESNLFHEIQLPEKMEITKLEDISFDIARWIRNVEDSLKEEAEEFFKEFSSDYEKEINRHDNAISNVLPNYQDALEGAKEELYQNLKRMEDNAGQLYTIAVDLVSRIYTVVSNYETYVKELEIAKSEGNADGSNQNKETIYATEIELAQANMGELLKNLDLLANSRAYLNDIANGLKNNKEERNKLSHKLGDVAETIANDWKEEPQKDKKNLKETMQFSDKDDKYTNGTASMNLYKEGYAMASVTYLADSLEIIKVALPTTQEYMCVLYSHVSYFQTGHYRQDVDVIVGEENKVWEKNVSSSQAAEQGNTEITAEENGRKLDSEKIKENANLLKVNYSYTADVGFEEFDASVSTEGEVDSGTIITMLETGLELITRIGDLLVNARDNLYVDAYILSMFPNYKEHYKEYEKSKESSILASPKGDYLASYAEVEFIITGAGANGKTAVAERVFAEGANGFGQLSVESMRLKLFGTRMLFNSLAMLTDSAKLQQASVLSTWAGPFAPLVSAVLIVCWIVAETVLDVMILMGDAPETLDNDGKIPLFKQSKDWLFSLNGVVSSLADYAVDTISKNILEKASDLTDSLQSQANVMIYQAYSAANTGISNVNSAIDNAVQTGTNALSTWSSSFQTNLTEFSGEVGLEETKGLANNLGNLSGELQTIANQKDQLVTTASSVTDNAKEQAVLAVNRMSNTIMEKTESYVEQAGNSAKEFISKNVSKVVPVGTVVNGGKAEIEMEYRDYLYFFLFIMNQETKVQRIQAVIQANINLNKEGTPVLLEQSPVAVWADLETTMKYMFMSNSIVPDNWKRDGRMRAKVISAQSY